VIGPGDQKVFVPDKNGNICIVDQVFKVCICLFEESLMSAPFGDVLNQSSKLSFSWGIGGNFKIFIKFPAIVFNMGGLAGQGYSAIEINPVLFSSW
jgi:hypothetical protein